MTQALEPKIFLVRTQTNGCPTPNVGVQEVSATTSRRANTVMILHYHPNWFEMNPPDGNLPNGCQPPARARKEHYPQYRPVTLGCHPRRQGLGE